MGVSIRTSRSTRVYVPFWAAVLFWLIAGPVVAACWLLYWTVRAIIALARVVLA